MHLPGRFYALLLLSDIQKSNHVTTFPPSLVYISFPFCSTVARIICLKPTTEISFRDYGLSNSNLVSPAQRKNILEWESINSLRVLALCRVDWVRLIPEKNIEFQDWMTARLICFDSELQLWILGSGVCFTEAQLPDAAEGHSQNQAL